MTIVMPIPNITALIARCWMKAEKLVREGIEQRFHDADEDFITNLFHGEFRGVLEADAKNEAVERAFLEDLRLHIPESHLSSKLAQLARGISATVVLHPRQVEKMTGGDIGLVLIRPNVGRQRIQVGTPPNDLFNLHGKEENRLNLKGRRKVARVSCIPRPGSTETSHGGVQSE